MPPSSLAPFLDHYPSNAMEFETRFGTEAACQAYLRQVRWPQGWRCPRCGGDRAWTGRRPVWRCAQCGYESSLTAGTIFHGSRKPLRLWFKAIYWMLAAKNGLSAKTLQRELGLSYPTAWTWLHKLRSLMAHPDSGPLEGCVQVDETLVGHDEAGCQGRRKGDRSIVAVLVEEKGPAMGRARLCVSEDFSAQSLQGFIAQHVAPGSVAHTDGWSGYEGIEKKGYIHRAEVIDQGDGKAAKRARAKALLGHVHWLSSLLKRWLLGTHQGAVRPQHLQAYLDEFVFRFNRRHCRWRTQLFQTLLSRAASRQATPYWRLVGRTAPDKPLHLAAA